METSVCSPGPSRSSSPTTDALRAVSDEIKVVEGNIGEVTRQSAEANDKIISIMAAKGKGWQVELAHWEKEKQLLVERERLLRHEKQQLREKELYCSSGRDRWLCSA